MLKNVEQFLSFFHSFNVQLLICEFLFALAGVWQGLVKVRKKGLWLGLVLILIYCHVFNYGLFPAYYKVLNRYFSISFLLIWVASMVIMSCCFQIRWPNMVFISICGWTFQHFLAYVSIILETIVMLPPEYRNLIKSGLNLAITVGMFFWIILPNIRVLLDTLNPVFSTVVVIYALLVVCVINYLYYESGNANIYLYICQIINCISLMMIEIGFTRLLKSQREKEILTSILAAAEKQYTMMSENNELLNIKYHDIKRHIEAIKILDAGNEAIPLNADLEKIVSTYTLISKTGNPTIDGLLTQKALECERRKIKFSYMVDTDGLHKISSVDLYVMLSNAVDNAIEAVCNVEEEHRIITLNIKRARGFIRFCMDNYCDKEIRFEGRLPITTKQADGFHGYGLKSIKQIAEKYDGHIAIDVKDHMFTLIILIPESSSDEQK